MDFPDNKKTPEYFAGFVASSFSLLFIRPIHPFSRDVITLTQNPFNLTDLEKTKIEMKEISNDTLKLEVRLTSSSNMWIDQSLASLVVEMLGKWIMTSHEVTLYQHMPIVSTYAYILSTLIILMPSHFDIMADKFISSFFSVPINSDTDDDHRGLGIVLTTIKKYGSPNDPRINQLSDKFDFFRDEEDSFELQKYLFEEEIVNNLSCLYLVNSV